MATTQIEKLKLFVFPGLASILGIMIWNTVTEIKTDMKFLMAQSGADHVRIDNLERVVYGKTTEASNDHRYPPTKTPPATQEFIAVMPDNRLTKSLATKKK
jgi:hypothetical protein